MNKTADWGSESLHLAAAPADFAGALAPMIEKLGRGNVEPGDRASANGHEAKRAIETLLGTKVRTIVFVTAEAYAADPVWHDKRTYARTLAIAIERTFNFFWLAMKAGGENWKEARGRLGCDVAIPLDEYVAHEEKHLPAENVRAAILGMFGHLFTADLATAERFVPILHLMPRAMPLGALASDPTTWVFLTG